MHQLVDGKRRLLGIALTAGQAAELTRLLALGATVVTTSLHWTTLADPEGNEFDLVRR